ncbi:MAG: hypothetical protein N2037_12540 [Acidimicrobiales bacterium]|nr:hypothetical protein [Acidimicrobiales bacterium]
MPSRSAARLRIAVFGVGAVGARLARQLLSSDQVASVALRDRRADHLAMVVASLGDPAHADGYEFSAPVDADLVVLAGDPGEHGRIARRLLAQGLPVISVSDDVADVRALLDLDAEAKERGVSLVVGAGFTPGLSCVLAAHAASTFDQVDEIHVAKVGTGGPACARQHHRALGARAVDWRDGWVERPGGSGRELCWFPDPIRARDCYRAALPDALLLVPAFPGVSRVTARVAATRRDRLTARLPMLWPTHPEGGLGAARVEVRGRRGVARDVVVFGAIDRPAVAAGSVAAIAALAVLNGEVRRPGAGGLAELIDPVPFLTELRRRGVRAAVFQGEPVEATGANG